MKGIAIDVPYIDPDRLRRQCLPMSFLRIAKALVLLPIEADKRDDLAAMNACEK